MKTSRTVLTAAAALIFSTGLCSAAVFDFDFTPTFGTITASGTLTTDSLDLFANVVDISGTVNGVAIGELIPGVNILHTTGFATVFSFADVNGVDYEIAAFFPPTAFASSPADNAIGTLTITPDVPGTTPSPVPLPSTAPMFGAALVALGAVGYGLKRQQAATA